MSTTNRRSLNHRRGAAVWWALGLFAVAGLAVGGVMLSRGGERSSGGGALTADRAVAKMTSFDIVTTATGELEARERIEVRSPLERESTIVEIMAEGAWAKKGDVLIQLNVDDIITKIDEETLRVESAKAELVAAENSYNIQLNENESALRKSQLQVDLAELALRQWMEGDVKKKRQMLELDIDKATLEIDRLAERYLRSQELLAEGFVSKDECDRDEVSYIEAISAYNTTQVARDVYETYEYRKDEKSKLSDLEEAKSELERVRLNNDIELASKDAKRTNQRTQLSIMENRLTKLKRDRDAATIKAPSDGLIVYATSMERGGWGRGGGSEGPLQIGQQVYSNQLLMILPNTTEMIAAVRVSESMAGKVRPGQKVSVKVDAAGGRVYDGTVDSIGVMAESGGWRDPNLREYTVRVALAGTDADLKPAMRCEARVTLDFVSTALTIPVQGVHSDGPVHYVYTSSGSKFSRTPIKLGRRSDTNAEVLAGLNESDAVLIREPAPGEILSEPWKKDVLVALGYSVDESGRPMSEIRPVSGPGGARDGMPPMASPGANAAQDGAKAAGQGGSAPAGGDRNAGQPRSREGRQGGNGGGNNGGNAPRREGRPAGGGSGSGTSGRGN